MTRSTIFFPLPSESQSFKARQSAAMTSKIAPSQIESSETASSPSAQRDIAPSGSGFDPASPAPDRAAPRVWGIVGTLVWAVILFAVMVASSLIAVAGVAAWYGPRLPMDDPQIFLNHGVMIAATTSAALVPLLLTLTIAARLKGRGVADYLALHRPSRRHLALGIGAALALLAVLDALSWMTGRPLVPPVLVAQIESARDLNALAFFAFGILIAAPIGEEAVFRGFFYRGLSESRLGPVLAVVITALVFASMHVQYDAFVMTQIVAIGLVLGALRMASGSTLLTIVMHALYNAAALLQSMWLAGVFGGSG